MGLDSLMPELIALGQILFIDIVLAGDNAIVVGMAAAGLAVEQRRKAIVWGIAAATILRICFAAVTTQLMGIVGLILAGGVLLLWVCWKMFRELQAGHAQQEEAGIAALDEGIPDKEDAPKKTLKQAVIQILLADVSMSLDNVLAVAGAAHGHGTWVLVVGLGVSVVLMGVAATFIARLLNNHRWIAWVGLLVILYVAGAMIWEGWSQVEPYVEDAVSSLWLGTPHA